MKSDQSLKVLVRRPSRATAIGQTVVEEIQVGDSAELELISTQMLKQILSSSDKKNAKAIEDAADTDVEGVLARDTATGYFEIIDDDELQAILDVNDDLPTLSRPSDPTLEPLHDYVESENLSLVSTQALRHVFGDEEKAEELEQEVEANIRGFNPYDCY